MGRKWSLADMPELTGRQVIITGANSGLGFQSAKAMAAKGARITLACRDMDKARRTREQIEKVVPDALLEPAELDLGSLDSVRKFAEHFSAGHDQLHILMNNAGIMTTPLFRTEDGFEGQIGTNHFGHFALTGLLFPLIAGTSHSRIVTVSSNAHKGTRLRFDNLNFEDEDAYTPMRAYQASKLANLLFHFELARRLEQHRISCQAIAAHPGASVTNLGRHLTSNWAFALGAQALKLFLNSPAKAAWPQLRAATDPGAENGDYFGPDGKGEWRGKPTRVSASSIARDPSAAQTLWDRSQSLTGVRFLE